MASARSGCIVGTRQLRRTWGISRAAYCVDAPMDVWCNNRSPTVSKAEHFLVVIQYYPCSLSANST